MRRVFITGASSGIGKELALKLAKEGHSLALAARNQDKLESVAKLVRQVGGKAKVYPLDVREKQAQENAIKAFVEEEGGLDAAVANAGFGITKSILDTTPEDAHELFEVNFFGLLYTLQAASSYLQGGTFVGISSVVTYALPTGYGVYSASKAAVSALLTTMRRESRQQFKVVLVNPGETETDFWQVAEQKSGQLIPGKSPLPFAKPEKVGEAIARVIDAPKPEVFITKFERMLPIIRGAFPGILEHYMKLANKT